MRSSDIFSLKLSERCFGIKPTPRDYTRETCQQKVWKVLAPTKLSDSVPATPEFTNYPEKSVV